MSNLVHQIGELFLRAVPVMVIVLLFYVVMRALFFGPMLKVMAERNLRTLGAQKQAEAAQAAAAEKMRQYEEALKQARAKVYAEQEADRKKLLDERTATIKDARGKADTEVNAAKDRVAGELDNAKKDIQSTAAQLAAEIATRVLQTPFRPGSSTPGNLTSDAR
jgi:F0F1-type ATP synthase membrane subunit b/b'